VKIFYDGEGQPKLKHILEPTVRFAYDSLISTSDRIITQRFFYRNNYLFYGMTNHFMVKQERGSRDLVTLTLGQRYYFDPETSPLQNYQVEGKIPEYSDVEASLRIYPSNRYYLDFSAGYNPYESEFSRLRLGLNLGSPAEDRFLRINWYKSTDPFREVVAFSRHQINLYGGFKIPGLPLETTAELDYNILEKELLYSALAMVYHYQCIDFKADLRIFYFRDKPEAQFSFSLELGNIGRTNDFLGGLGF
jgi:hypothetical protein